MSITDKKVDDIAHLARLEFDAQGREVIKADLNKIIDFCDKLKEVNTEGVEPLIYMSDEHNVLREDKVVSNFSKEEALKNAPLSDSDYIKVPKVINKK